MPFHFSDRWQDSDPTPNALTEAIAARKKSGQPIFDLTASNPTQCGIVYPDWTSLLNQSSVQTYDPHPQGNLKAREAIAQYYAERSERVAPYDLFLTAGTSEGYAHLFKLLCDPGDEVLVSSPSYPLLETLASLEGIQIRSYFDLTSLKANLTERTRAIFLVQPNNPTGHVLSKNDADYLVHIAEEKGLALVVDEVFADFLYNSNILPLLHSKKSLVFTLNGLSKLLGLPQLKLAWIHVDGETSLKARAKKHLEWICDAYLSVSTASQAACPELLERRLDFQIPIQERLETNLSTLREVAKANPQIEPLWPQGGWCIPVRCKGVEDDEAFALELLEKHGVLVHPGYFFDFEEEDVVVLSLLIEPTVFREGLARLLPFGK